ncbi:MAG: thioredoxin-like domain-containing protein [Candidatus Poriferisodalaceae bacterium]
MSFKTSITAALLSAILACACSASDLKPDDGQGRSPGAPSEAPGSSSRSAQATDDVDFAYEGEIAAPEIPNALDWFNVERPLSLVSDLRGKIVVLDFWTQGCINCLHVIPDLHRLEDEYPDSLVVIGVHWAKFDHERTSSAVQQAVQRLGIRHPVVNDDYEYLRRSYRVRAWPTLVLIDPLGRVVGSHAGEGIYPLFQPVIDQMAKEYGAAGLIDVRPLDAIVASGDPIPTVLSFPGKVLADQSSNRLFIADSGHHRVLITDLAGKISGIIGGGVAGYADGAWPDVKFKQPQGLALSANGRYLYVADRGNHAIRVVDLSRKTVETLAGTGRPTHRIAAGPPLETPLASPWDVELVGEQLFVAGAGRHQIWVIDLLGNGEAASWIDVFAGTGAEGLDDGYRMSATLSQPSGLAIDGATLWFTDPEASAVRSIDLGEGGELRTLIGSGLFSWGDSTGDRQSTQLQHAVGIEVVNGDLYIADTYNHRIKIVEVRTGNSALVVGNGIPGLVDGTGEVAQLAEPSGLSVAGEVIYIADTNNHQIRTLDTRTGDLETLELTNQQAAILLNRTASDETVTFPQILVTPGKVELRTNLLVPTGYEFNDEGTFVLEVRIKNGESSRVVGRNSYEAQGPQMPQSFELRIEREQNLRVEADATVFYCPAQDAKFCLLRHITMEVPLVVSDTGDDVITLSHLLPSSAEIDRSLESIND